MEQTPAPIRIDLASSFIAINPANGNSYNEYNAVLFYVIDKRIIPALNAYKESCITLGSDSNHILSIELLIDRIKLFQAKGPDESNIIDRKFIIKAKLPHTDRIVNQSEVIVFCAKDKAFPAFINEYINITTTINQPDYGSIQALKDLLDRVMFYQENIEARVPDTNLEDEIQRCIHGIDVSDTSKSALDIHTIGNGDLFQILSKASSRAEGWMKSTTVMPIPGVGCLVQVTTQQQNPDGSYAIAEALTFVPGAEIGTDIHGNKKLIYSRLGIRID